MISFCKKQNIICSIKGEVNYSFYPTPRIKISDVIINDLFEKTPNPISSVSFTITLEQSTKLIIIGMLYISLNYFSLGIITNSANNNKGQLDDPLLFIIFEFHILMESTLRSVAAFSPVNIC